MDLSPFTSRKFILTTLVLAALVVIPVLYRHLGISDTITMMVLGAVATATGVYNVTNVAAKKYEDSSEPTQGTPNVSP